MTPGQERAYRELQRLQTSDPDTFEVTNYYIARSNDLVAHISIRLGLMETREGGLNLMEREDFIVVIPPDFPFDCPWIKVQHDRFANFDHVIWTTTLCLYQSKELEWNPSDGLYGFFDRLKIWLGRAAINDMDPVEGPLEPPHHITDFSQKPFVIRKNAPVESGKSWFGLAELKRYSNRVELIGWNDLSSEWPVNEELALAFILKNPLPMEFPKQGADFFKELLKQGIDKNTIIKYLALAALFTPEGEPIHLILGLPMRRASDGTPKIHIAVWITSSDLSKNLKSVLPKKNDNEKILNIRQEISDRLYSFFEKSKIIWCKVMEDRDEILERRDKDSPLTWLTNKKVLILGCGALGSWTAEVIARAKPSLMHLVDNSNVNIGILSRQNYTVADFCTNKSEALEKRIKTLFSSDKIKVENFSCEAHKYLTEDTIRMNFYDLIVDCTASEIFQMKLEKDWSMFQRKTATIISMVIDAQAKRCLSVGIKPNSLGGIWDAYVQLKKIISSQGNRIDIIESFYSDKAIQGLFQPEPGCSDPTFSGSTADIFALVSMALNNIISKITSSQLPSGIAFSVHSPNEPSGRINSFDLIEMQEITVGKYRVRISQNIEKGARGWVKQNKRVRSERHETGGLLWGLWDDAINVIWILDISGPPPDSQHEPAHFLCGIEGTQEEHKCRIEQSNGTCGFVGLWHTHPKISSGQSIIDINSMSNLVSNIGQNQKRVVMLIFGQRKRQPTANLYVYESQSIHKTIEFLSVGEGELKLNKKVT